MKRFALILVPLFAVSVAYAQDDLPAGEGSDVVNKICTACHGLESIVSNHMDASAWKDTVQDMVGRGADATEAQVKTISDYLGKYYGPFIKVNTASSEELAKSFDITAKDADAIVAYRKSKGNFKAWADVQKVTGIDMKKVEPLKGRILYSN